MNFNISPAFEKCTENLSKLGKKRYWKKRKKKNGWKMNRVENRYMTSLCDKLFGAGKKVSGHNWWMWTCTNVIGWLQISVYDTSQMLVDVNLHRCQFLVLQISDFSCWLMSTGRCQPAAQMSLVVWWPASFASLARCCLMTRVVSRLQLMSPHLPIPLLFSVRNVKNALFASMKYFVFCTFSNNPDHSKELLNVVFSFMGEQIKMQKYVHFKHWTV